MAEAGHYYKHKNVLPQKTKFSLKKTLRGVANALGVLIVVLVLGPLFVVVFGVSTSSSSACYTRCGLCIRGKLNGN